MIYAIGDIHGRYDLLYRMMLSIREDLSCLGSRQAPLFVFLGDYIDRGPKSKDVIQALYALSTSPVVDAQFLRGNHEQAMMDFLDNVDGAEAWLSYGGIPTLISYGIVPQSFRVSDMDTHEVREALRARLPKKHETFLRGTRLMTEVGDYAFVHAGVRPNVPLADQAADDLLWIRSEFLESSAPLERVIVHGHTPEAHPHFDDRRIGLDTGAYMTGVLTAARLFGSERAAIQVSIVAAQAKRKSFGTWERPALNFDAHI